MERVFVIKIKVYISLYDWDLTVIFNAEEYLNIVAFELKKLHCTYELVKDAIRVVSKFNSGFCYTDYYTRATLICLSVMTSKYEFFNTVVHELKHYQTHVCEYYNIAENSEEAAYLIGDTAEKLYKALNYELDKYKKLN